MVGLGLEVSCAVLNFGRRLPTTVHRPLNIKQTLFPGKQNSQAKTPDVSLPEALGTVNSEGDGGNDGTLGLGGILCKAEFQEVAARSGTQALELQHQPFFPVKQNSPAQVPDVSLQDALRTFKTA